MNYLQEHAGGEIVRGVGSIKLSGKIVEPKDGKGYKASRGDIISQVFWKLT